LSDKMCVRTFDIGARDKPWLTAFLSIVAFISFPFRRRPDIVHIHTSGYFSKYRSALYALIVVYLWQRPVVIHFNGSRFVHPDNIILKRFLIFTYSKIDSFLVVSNYWADQVDCYMDNDKIKIVRNPIDTNIFNPNFSPPTEYRRDFSICETQVVFMAEFIPRKGIEELCEAITLLNNEGSTNDFCFTIAGDGELRDLVEDVNKKYDNVEYVGFVSGDKKLDILAASDISVLPTYSEGMPFGILEGMAMKNAIVSTPVTSIPECVEDGVNGFLVEPGNAKELAEALRKLIDDPQLVWEMGETNRELMQEEYSWDVIAEQLENIYVDSISGSGESL